MIHNQSNNPPMPTSYYSYFGGYGALGASFLAYLPAGFSSFFYLGASLTGAVRAASSGILNLWLNNIVPWFKW